MILIGVVLFTITMPKQASPRESIITMKYWSDYVSSLFCECNKFWSNQEGYRVIDTTDSMDNGDDDDDDDRNKDTGEDTET